MRDSLMIRPDFDWDNQTQLDDVRDMISQSPLTDTEFSYLVQLGKATRLNPFNREIWAIKYSSNSPAQIFIGRDGYRLAASRHPMYLRHQVTAVYSKDDFKVINDEIIHNYGLGDRGTLESAYCKVFLKGQPGYSYVHVTMKEYGLNQSVWKQKPETMLKKVAEAQALRQSFPDFFAGTYSDTELPQEEQKTIHLISGETQTQKLKNILGIGEKNGKKTNDSCVDYSTGEYIDSECDNVSTSSRNHDTFHTDNERHGVRLSDEQSELIINLFKEKNFSKERIKKAFSSHEVNDLHELDNKKAQKLISQLERIQ